MICSVIILVGGVIGMALMRPESETMRWASEMPEAAVEPTYKPTALFRSRFCLATI
jgi:hypothetical protein